MNLGSLKSALREHSDKALLFVLPDGDPIPAEFHVTEVGHVAKNFIDCGGTRRSAETAILQVWVSESDPGHRLAPGKLLSILELAGSVVPSDDLGVEVEYEGCSVSQYPVVGFSVGRGELRFALGEKHTDCLAREACGLGSCDGAPSGSAGKCC
jgi:Family of unknown function (DUF6428)